MQYGQVQDLYFFIFFIFFFPVKIQQFPLKHELYHNPNICQNTCNLFFNHAMLPNFILFFFVMSECNLSIYKLFYDIYLVSLGPP